MALDDGENDHNELQLLQTELRFWTRICPGRFFAHEVLSIYIASALHVLDITPGTDASGRPVQLTDDIEGALLMYVLLFFL